jgi:WD40 repeat protein
MSFGSNGAKSEPSEIVMAVSPDGRWIAAGAHDDPGQPGAIVWETATGKRAGEIPARPFQCRVGFSPDGRWLLTTGGCRLWEAGTWRPGPVLGGVAAAFAPDGKLLAVDGGEGVVQLVDPATGREYARLASTGETRSLPRCFSPDGELLVLEGEESRALHVWDQRAERANLRPLGLDWDRPPYPVEVSSAPPRLELVEK